MSGEPPTTGFSRGASGTFVHQGIRQWNIQQRFGRCAEHARQPNYVQTLAGQRVVQPRQARLESLVGGLALTPKGRCDTFARQGDTTLDAADGVKLESQIDRPLGRAAVLGGCRVAFDAHLQVVAAVVQMDRQFDPVW